MASIKQRPDGRWRARYRDDSGREHARHFVLKRDAQRWINEVTASVITGQYVDPRAGRETWSVWVKSWMARQSWAEGTVEAATTAVESVPWVDQSIRSVKPSHVQGWVSGEVKRGLAASTVKTRLNYVQMAFRAAVSDRVIPASPAADIKAPRARRQDAAMKILTIGQTRTVLDEAGDFRPFVEVCLFAGLRLGEAAGLQLGDVNFLARSIRVERQVQGSTIKTARTVPPKYGSERTIFVPNALIETIAAHVSERRITDLAEPLFTNPLGALWNRNSAGEQWRRIRTTAKLSDDFTLHALRHTYASNLIASGCDVVTVQRALGHSQPSITLNVYSHLWPSAEDRTRAATATFMEEIAAPADSPRTGDEKPQVRRIR